MSPFIRKSLTLITLLSASLFTMAQLAVNVTIDKHVSCPDGDDAQITVALSGMVAGNYYIEWKNLDTGEEDYKVVALPATSVIFPSGGADKINMPSGFVSVTVIKLSAPVEVVTQVITIYEPDPLALTVTQPTCAVPTGTIEVTSPTDTYGGTYSFQYSVDGGGSYQAGPEFTGLAPGNDYDVRVEITSHTTCYLDQTETINPAPTPPSIPTATVTQTTCSVATGSIEVTDPLGADYEYSNNFGASWQDSPTFSGLTPDSYLVSVRRKSDNTCQSNKIFTINPQPAPPAAPTLSITQPTCAVPTGTITVTAPVGVDYQYNNEGGAFQAGTSFSGLAPGDYDIRVRLASDNTCVSSPTTGTVNTVPDAPVIQTPVVITHPTTPSSNDGEIGVTVIGGTGTNNFFLSYTAGGAITNTGLIATSNHTFTGLDEGNYEVTVIDSDGCSSVPEDNIILASAGCVPADIDLISLPGTDNQTVCDDETIDDIEYLVSGDFTGVSVAGLPAGVSGSFDVGLSIYTISGTPTETGIFNYTVTVTGTCVDAFANGTITVNAPVSPTFTALGPYCLDEAPDALPGVSNNGITGSWIPAVISTASSGTTTYMFTPDAGQCATTGSMDILVKPAPTNVDAGPDVTICEGESTQLNGTADGPLSNESLLSENFTGLANGQIPAGWSRTHTNWGARNTALAGETAPEMRFYWSPSTTTTFRLVSPLIDATSHEELSLSFKHYLDHFNGNYSIRVQTSPDGVIWTNMWSITNVLHDIAAEAINVDLTAMDGTNFYIAFTYVGPSNSINSWNIDNVELTGDYASGITYSWLPIAGLSNPNIPDPIANPAVTTTYTLTATLDGCTATDDVTVTVEPIETPVFTLDPTYTYCEGDVPVTLPAISDNGISGTWDPSTISTATTGTTIYTFTPDAGECADETSIEVTVLPLPTATISGGGSYCEGVDPTGVDVVIDLTGTSPWTFVYSADGDIRTIEDYTLTQFIHEDATEGHFTLVSVEDANCTGTTSGEAFVVEIPAPTATISGDGEYCEGVNPTGLDVTIVLTGTGPWDFVYSIGGAPQAPVTGVLSSPYIIEDVTAGLYELVSVVDATGCDGTVSGSATVTEKPLPVPTISTLDPLVYCAGDPISTEFTVDVVGDSYQWLLDGTPIGGATANTYTATTEGEYSVIVTVSGCDGTSNILEVIVNPLPVPTISTTDPLDYCAGDPISTTFAIDIVGDSYQWLLGGAPIGGATADSYTATAAGEYSVIVTISGCDGTSNSLEVVVNPLPVPTISTVDPLVYCAGDPISTTFTIDIVGDSYQWLLDGAPIGGATNNTYTAGAAGEYSVVVTTLGCDGTSNVLEIVVNPLPVPTISTVDPLVYCAGDPISTAFTIDIAGDSYQWLLDGAPIGGATANTYTATAAGEYSVVVTTLGCDGISNSLEIIVNPLPVPTISTTDPLEYCFGDAISTTFTIDITGDSYQWLLDGAPIGGATSDTYTATAAGDYSVVVTIAGCDGTSNILEIVVNPLPLVYNVTGGGSYCAGEAGVDVGLDDSEVGVTYTLYLDGNLTATTAPGDGDDISFGLQTLEGAYTVYAQNDITGCEEEMNGSVSITIDPLPTATMSGGGSYCEGVDPTGVTVIIDLTGTAPWTFTYAADGDLRTVEDYPDPQFIHEDATEGHFTIISVSDANCTGTVSGEAFVVEVSAPTGTISGGGDYCEGLIPTGIDVTITLTGTGPWDVVYSIDGVAQAPVIGILSSPFILEDVTAGLYELVSVNDASICDGTISGSATVIEKPLPVPTISTIDDLDYCADEIVSTTFTIDIIGDSYQWLLDGAPIVGATTDTYTSTAAGVYSVVVTIDGCDGISNTLEIIVNPLPVPTISTLDPLAYCDGDVISTVFAIDITGDSYQWLLDGAPIVGATGDTYTATAAGEYSVIVTTAGCNGTSNVIEVIVNPLPVPTISTLDPLVYCADEVVSTTFTIDITGDSYQWLLDGNPIVGATSNTYTADAAGTYSVVVTDEGCVGTSNELEIIVNPLPTATMSGGGSYCEDEDPTGVDVIIDLTGTAPWTFTYAADADTRTVEDYPDPQFIHEDATAAHFTLISVSDANCVGLTFGEAFVTEIVTAAPTGDALQEFCFGSTIDDIEVTGTDIHWYDAPVDGALLNGTDVLVDGATYYATQTLDGCEGVARLAVTVNVNDVLEINIITLTNPVCFGDESGSIEVQATGGVLPYTYTLLDEFNNPTGDEIVAADGDPVVFSDIAQGTYSVSVNDDKACGPVATAPFTINQPDEIVIDPLSTIITNSTCNGSDDGVITVVATGGTGNLYYTLLENGLPVIGPQTMNGTFIDLAPGTYVVSITDDENCGPILSDELTVTEPDEINITTTVNNIACFGDQGSIAAEANQGTAPYTIELLQDGAPVASFAAVPIDTEVLFENLDVGDPAYVYVVRVTDANLCIANSADLTITEAPEITIDSEIVTNGSCNGSGDGSITIAASGGTGVLTYTLFEDVLGELTNNTDGIFAGLAPGTYTITITDESLCAGPTGGPYVIIEPAAITYDVNVTGLDCFGDLVTVTVDNVAGGSGLGYQYSFNGEPFTGSNVYTFTPTVGGVDEEVTIIVKDDADCETTVVETIAIPEALTIDLTVVQHPGCNGGSDGIIEVTSTGGVPPVLYEIDGSGDWATETTFSGLGAGIHSIIAIDFNGCTATDFIELYEPDLLTFTSIITSDPSCYDPGSIVVFAEGGTGTIVYTLQPGGVSNTIGVFSDLPGGDYVVFVTDDNLCGPIGSGTITLATPALISIDDIVIADATGCFGTANNGTIEIIATGGSAPLEYSIDNGLNFSSNNLFEDLEPGDYIIVVTDGVCPEYALATIDGPTELTYTIITEQAENPAGAGNAIIIVEASGGTGAYTYTLWEDLLGEVTNNATGIFNDLENGLYWVVITDEEGCIVTTTNIFLAGLEITITPTHITCFGANDGQIEVTVTGGTPPYSISWTGPDGPMPEFDDLLIATDLKPGLYNIDIEDNAGLVANLTETILEPTALELLTMNTINPTCSGSTDGSIFVEAQGGTAPYNYTLTDINDDEVIATSEGLYENLIAGDYTLEVEDANGCIFTEVISLPEAEAITYTVDKTHPTGTGLTDGIIEVVALPDTYTYTYTLFTSDDVEVESNSTGIFNDLGAGTYYVIIENEFGCTEQTSDIILTGMTIILEPHHVSCFEGSDGWINVVITGGLPPIGIVLTNLDTGEEYDPGVGINEDEALLPAGSYSVTVTDNAGNSITQTVEITQPQELLASIIDAVNPECNGVANGYVVFDIEGGTPDYTISWDGGSSPGFVAEPLAEGTYNFVITDANGCEYIVEEEVVITYPEALSLTTLTYFDIACFGEATGYISILVEGGTQPITYTVTGPDGFNETNNSGVFSQLVAGVYNLFVEDANGCEYVFEEGNRIVITQPDLLEINTLVSEIEPLDCHYDNAGIINMLVTGGTPDYTYLWSNGQQTLDLINPTPGTYTIRVTDSQGCIAYKDVLIPGPEPFAYDVTIQTANCKLAPTGDIGSISINSITGGNGVFSIDFGVKWFSETLGDLPIYDGNWNPDGLSTGNYKAYITDAKSCKDTLELFVPFDETKHFTLDLSAPDTTCYGAEIEISVLANQYLTGEEYDLSGSSIKWFNLNISELEPVNEQQNFTTSITEKTKYRIDVLSDLGCLVQHTDSMDVYNRMLPYIPRLADQHPFMITSFEDTSVIAVLTDTQYEFTVVEGGAGQADTYSWQPNSLFFPAQYTWNEFWIDETVNPYMEFATGIYESLMTGEFTAPSGKKEKYVPVTLQVVSTDGCTEIVDFKAIVLNRLRIPNAFSPNDDGINDNWMIPYVELFADLRVRVYNRWGALIWEAQGSELSEGWNGKNSNGRDYPVGTYYYVIDFNVDGSTKWKPISGSITIVR